MLKSPLRYPGGKSSIVVKFCLSGRDDKLVLFHRLMTCGYESQALRAKEDATRSEVLNTIGLKSQTFVTVGERSVACGRSKSKRSIACGSITCGKRTKK